MPPVAIGLGAAAIGGVATVAAAKKNSKAIKQATQVQQDSTNQQIALQRDVYAKNQAALAPYMQRGNVAGDHINALLGLGQTAGTPTSAAASNSALAAYEAFKNSAGYQTRFDEGMRSLNAGFAGAGLVQSGAAQKAALRYGQNFASNEFGNYMGYLGNQQGVGFAGASALAGVGQNFANNMGAISQNNANTQGQAIIAGAQNNGALWTGLAGIAGQTAGALSSYRNPASYTTGLPALY